MKTTLKVAICLGSLLHPLCLANADDICSGLGGKKQVAHIKTKDFNIYACAEAESGRVSDLSIHAGKKGNEKTLFEGDTAFKAYQVKAEKTFLLIEESINNIRSFKPFVQYKASCDSSDCKFKHERCLRPKRELDAKDLQTLHKIKNRKARIDDTLIEQLFEIALSGNREALNVFNDLTAYSDHAAASEAYATYREDVEKLKEACMWMTQTGN
jgi:hypothetical protein